MERAIMQDTATVLTSSKSSCFGPHTLMGHQALQKEEPSVLSGASFPMGSCHIPREHVFVLFAFGGLKKPQRLINGCLLVNDMDP